MKNYDKIMNGMTPEIMAELGVKLVSVNNRDLYYMTSSGQLFYTSDYQSAVQHEFNWLMVDQDQDNKDMSETNKVLTEECNKESTD